MTSDQKLAQNLNLLGLGCGESCGCRDNLVGTLTPKQRTALANLDFSEEQVLILKRIQDTKKVFAELGIGAHDDGSENGDLESPLDDVLGMLILSSLLDSRPRSENPLEELLGRIRRTPFRRN